MWQRRDHCAGRRTRGYRGDCDHVAEQPAAADVAFVTVTGRAGNGAAVGDDLRHVAVVCCRC